MTPQEDKRLDQILAAYDRSFFEIEESPAFLPQVWEKIDNAKSVSWLAPLRQWAWRVTATATMAAALLTGSLWLQQLSRDHSEPLLNASYVDALAVDSMDEADSALWQLTEHGR